MEARARARLYFLNLFSYHIDQLSGICGEEAEINEHAGSQKHRIPAAKEIQWRALIFVGRSDRDQLTKFGPFLLSYCPLCMQKIVQ